MEFFPFFLHIQNILCIEKVWHTHTHAYTISGLFHFYFVEKKRIFLLSKDKKRLFFAMKKKKSMNEWINEILKQKKNVTKQNEKKKLKNIDHSVMILETKNPTVIESSSSSYEDSFFSYYSMYNKSKIEMRWMFYFLTLK